MSTEDKVKEHLYKTLKEKLYMPFDQVDYRPAAGGNRFSFVKSKFIFDRMNDVFGTGWSTEIISHEIIGDEFLVVVKVTILAQSSGVVEEFCQFGFGSAKKFGNQEIGNLFKSAESNAIKDAVKKWGVALHIEEDDNGGQQYTAPSTSVVPPTVPNNTGSAPPVFSGANSAAPSSQPPFPTDNSSMVPPPVTNTPPTTESTTSTVTPPLPSTPGEAGTAFGGTNNEGKITDIQKVALETVLNIGNITYEELIKKALPDEDNIPESIDDVDFKTAAFIINFGNKLFRGNK